MDGYPLFLLDTVLLPTEVTVLHVFEPRYRELAARCLDGDEQFGFVFVGDDGRPSEFGCATRITDVIQRYDDGRLDIVVRGVEPIRLVQIEERFAYPSALVEHVPESPAGAHDPAQWERTRDAFSALLRALDAELPDDEELDVMNAYAMAARISLEAQDKQAMLELRDENERLALLERTLTGATARVKAERDLSRHARGNGHRPHGRKA